MKMRCAPIKYVATPLNALRFHAGRAASSWSLTAQNGCLRLAGFHEDSAMYFFFVRVCNCLRLVFWGAKPAQTVARYVGLLVAAAAGFFFGREIALTLSVGTVSDGPTYLLYTSG